MCTSNGGQEFWHCHMSHGHIATSLFQSQSRALTLNQLQQRVNYPSQFQEPQEPKYSSVLRNMVIDLSRCSKAKNSLQEPLKKSNPPWISAKTTGPKIPNKAFNPGHHTRKPGMLPNELCANQTYPLSTISDDRFQICRCPKSLSFKPFPTL